MTKIYVNGKEVDIITTHNTTIRDLLNELKIDIPKTTDDIDLTNGFNVNNKNVKIWSTIPKYYPYTNTVGYLYMGLRAKVESCYIKDIYIEIKDIVM